MKNHILHWLLLINMLAMKSRQIGYAGLLLASLFMISCNPGIYVPAFQNAPLFQKKGELNLMVSQTNLQGAVAIRKNIGLAMNLQHVNASSQELLSKYKPGNQSRIELAGGYFTQKKTARSPIYELYAGGGYGIIKYEFQYVWAQSSATGYTLSDPTFASRNWNVFLQPAVGFRSKRSSIALSTKINYISYTNSSIGISPYVDPYGRTPNSKYDDLTKFDKINSLPNSHHLFIEPAITALTGGNRLRVVLQLFTQVPIINSSMYKLVDGHQTFIRFGLLLKLNGSDKKKNAP